ncbi:LON peptidase substrate-binding domain-containing protein [Idiomarina xiamenensis]|uniref:Peptidase S16 lon domain-containing protein n=1 Tax=Idiomarina xiamenensis 10-D-4 TaxID=740709 RepID=K2KFW2_9GAMM|nr:LON peptidase substrate-binding domain-containing protein [Idiomarina xiamenensis]EKE86898.1 peptidase S16 lon domain-containing protein [Idiomarina xiamenensis 10-D-4]
MAVIERLSLLPLTAHLLPGGRLKLRIFEQRYMRMVKDAMRDDASIGICMLNQQGNKSDNSHIWPLGTLAKIVDFEPLPDGLLGITVAGQQRFRLKTIDTEKDQLRVGQATLLENWPDQALTREDELLRERLEEIYQTYPELCELYSQRYTDNANWLCQRWLELLPLEGATKQQLLAAESLDEVLDYLRQLIQ